MDVQFAEWLTRQRWYAGRGRMLTRVETGTVVSLRADVELILLDAT